MNRLTHAVSSFGGSFPAWTGGIGILGTNGAGTGANPAATFRVKGAEHRCTARLVRPDERPAALRKRMGGGAARADLFVLEPEETARA